MGVIFFVSTDFGSSENTSQILEPLLRWVNPEISGETVNQIHFLIRKGGHLSEYAILAWLALRAVRSSLRLPAGVWSWKAAGLALLVAATYAATDEFHQSFVPQRTSSPIDVMIDTTGAVIALLLAFAWGKISGASKLDQSPAN